MPRLFVWLSKSRALLGRRTDADIDEELQHHQRLLAEKFMLQGMTSGDAWHAARRQFGNTLKLKETRTEMLTFVWLETMIQDLKYGLRMLLRNKAFAAVAVLTLALGIGANTAIFSVVNAVVLHPMPYPDPSRLLILWGNVKRLKAQTRRLAMEKPVSQPLAGDTPAAPASA